MIEETLNINSGSTLLTSAVYDGIGNLINVTYPGGRNLSYDYDALNRISQINESSNLLVEYDYIGSRVEQKRFLNGTKIDYGYDELGRIEDIIHTNTSSTLLSQAFDWDVMSNKTARSIDGVTETYAYDDLYRLESFSYDEVGNRTDTGYQIGLSGPSFEMNEYIETPIGSFDYNANGNLSSIDTTDRVMAYDYRNQMVSYDDGAATTYRYDALGRRISKSNNSGETRYYSLGSRVIEETTSTNNTATTYVYGNYIDEVLSMNRNSNNYYYHSDDIYNVMMLTNAAGGMAEDYDYDPFGKPDDVGTVVNPYMFNGREYDAESGFYNYRTRYLDPSVGRFTTRDTIGIWGDPSNIGNPYTYVGNNPQTFVDPFGLQNFFGGFVNNQQESTNEAIRQLGYNPYDSYTSNTELANIEAGIQYGYATGKSVYDTTNLSAPEDFYNSGQAALNSDLPGMERAMGAAGAAAILFTLGNGGKISKAAENSPGFFARLWDNITSIFCRNNNADDVAKESVENALQKSIKALPPAIVHDHHIFPIQFAGYFRERGIDIDDFTVTLGEKNHLRGVHGAGFGNFPGRWNSRWLEFIDKNPKATAEEIYQHAGQLMDEFKLSGQQIHPYGK